MQPPNTSPHPKPTEDACWLTLIPEASYFKLTGRRNFPEDTSNNGMDISGVPVYSELS